VTLSKTVLAKIRELAAELEIVRIGGPSAVQDVLGEIRRLTELETLLCACPVERTTGWAVERLEADNFPNPSAVRDTIVEFLERAPRRFGWFDASRPEPEQRNVVVDVRELVPEPELVESRVYQEVLRPLRLHRHHPIRVLVCEGASLLAWFGGFQPAPATPVQRELLLAIVPALRRRLSIERRIETASLTQAALDAVLERIGAPAFVVSASGRIFELNAQGKALLESQRAEVSASLRAAATGHPPALAFELTPLRMTGVDALWLAILRPRTSDARMAQSIHVAAKRLGLTGRQRQVLERVVRGDSNAAIAGALRISERAVEQHLSAVFDRAAVDSRAALVSLVLLGK